MACLACIWRSQPRLRHLPLCSFTKPFWRKGANMAGEARHRLHTDVPIGERSAIRAKLTAYRSYAVAARARRPLGALMWDLANPYHHARTAHIGNPRVPDRGWRRSSRRRGHRYPSGADRARRVRAQPLRAGGDHPSLVGTDHRDRRRLALRRSEWPMIRAASRPACPATAWPAHARRFCSPVSVRGTRSSARLLAPDRARTLASVGRNVGRNLAAAKRRLTDGSRSWSPTSISCRRRRAC